MEGILFDTDLEPVAILDTFQSLIWVDRFSSCGDFEIYLPIDAAIIPYLSADYYLTLRESNHCMIIEDFLFDTDEEQRNYLTVTGRSLESILDRRIIWGQTILTGNLQNGIQSLLNANAISPAITERTIPNLIFEASDDSRITELEIDAQYNGENLYDTIVLLCQTYDIGFKITLREDNMFVFKLYAGVDRSYDQEVNPYIIFSTKFDNILSSNYLESKKTLKTVTLVAGEGEGAERQTTSVESNLGGGIGLNRREIFTDAGDISKTVDEGTLTDEEYLAQLAQRGAEVLSENTIIQSFEGQLETSQMYKYGEDFFMGDIVQAVNSYGMESKARIVEYIISQSASGIDIYPTFATVG